LPIAQPPGSDTVASPIRASSGPSTRIEARILRTMSYGAVVEVIPSAFSVITRPNSSPFTPFTMVDTPSMLSRCMKLSTSARRGRFLSSRISSVSSAQGISVSAAFLAPEMWMRPLRRLPPRMRIRSMGRGYEPWNRAVKQPARPFQKVVRRPCT
jgi:hypothetical protein